MQNCEWCGGPMPERERFRFPSQRPRTCSRSCGVKLALKEGRGRQPTKRLCEFCGKENKGRSPRTCSRRCGVRLAVKEGRWHAPKNGFGPENTNWRGGRKITRSGYVYVTAPLDHPHRGARGYMAEHRLVMEQHIGRYLDPIVEIVHHRNGVKDDNRIENLEIVTHARPNGWVICPHCRKSFQVH